MTSTTTDDPLMARAKALKLYGLLAHWQEVAGSRLDRAPDPVGGSTNGRAARSSVASAALTSGASGPWPTSTGTGPSVVTARRSRS